MSYRDELRALAAANKRHLVMGGYCWCGHGSEDFSPEGLDNTDGAHGLMGVPHGPDCPPDCNSYHFHEHCRACATSGQTTTCCILEDSKR